MPLDPQEIFLAYFIAHCESYAHDVENAVLVIKVCCCRFWETETLYCRTLYFSLIIVKSLQLRERRQIAKLCKYCLVCVIIFLLVCVLSILCFSQVWEFQINSLQIVVFGHLACIQVAKVWKTRIGNGRWLPVFGWRCLLMQPAIAKGNIMLSSWAGVEYFSHVWLLMAHFGLTEQFQISRGHARA